MRRRDLLPEVVDPAPLRLVQEAFHERVLRHGFETLPDGANDHERADAALLKAFPLDRARVCSGTLDYVRDPDAEGRGSHEPPYDMYMTARLLLHRHMRLAFEEDADWLVETLEQEREVVAAQAAYALALDREAGDRPAPEDGEAG